MMQGYWEKQFRDGITDRVGRIYGLKKVHTVADGETSGNLQARMSRLPVGPPVIIQDSAGNPTFIAGFDGPL